MASKPGVASAKAEPIKARTAAAETANFMLLLETNSECWKEKTTVCRLPSQERQELAGQDGWMYESEWQVRSYTQVTVGPFISRAGTVLEEWMWTPRTWQWVVAVTDGLQKRKEPKGETKSAEPALGVSVIKYIVGRKEEMRVGACPFLPAHLSYCG